jgi:hypothetical protein
MRFNSHPDDLARAAFNAPSPEIRRRILVERAIVRRLCDEMIARGYRLRLWDGEAWLTVNGHVDNTDAIMADVQSCDDEVLYLFAPIPEGGWRQYGSVTLIYGNDGWDVIADNSMHLEDELEGVNVLIAQFEQEADNQFAALWGA